MLIGTKGRIDRQIFQGPLLPPLEKIRKVLLEVSRQYPDDLKDAELAQVDRYAYHVGLVYIHGGKLIDIGSGIGAFPMICQSLGMEVTIVDDFQDDVNFSYNNDAILSVHRSYGVEVFNADALKVTLPFGGGTIDCISTFDSIEHWHHSPKQLFEEVTRVLKPGGRFVIGAPNAVNLLKRIRVLLGKSNYVSWKEFYYNGNPFRGHVREPILQDLLDSMTWNGLKPVACFGKNWMAIDKYREFRTWFGKQALKTLETFPTLCSDLYVVGVKE